MNFNNFTIKSQEAVQKAVELVQSNGQQVVETPHLLKGIMLTGEEVLQFLFGKTGVNTAMLSCPRLDRYKNRPSRESSICAAQDVPSKPAGRVLVTSTGSAA